MVGEEECPSCGKHFKIILEPVDLKGLKKPETWKEKFEKVTDNIRLEARGKGLNKLSIIVI